MAEKMKVSYPDPATGSLSEDVGEIINMLEAKEPWSEYVLEDGNKIRAKQVITNIVKLDKIGQDGNPIYVLQSQQVLFVVPKQ